MSQKFDGNFLKNYDEDSDIEYRLEIDVEYPKRLHNFHNDLPFLTERRKIVARIRTLKQTLNHRLILKTCIE